MTPTRDLDRYRNRLVTLIAFVLAVAALRASYTVTMPLSFAAIIIAALWPLKIWLDRWLPSWLSYILTMLALIIVLAGFAAAVYFSLGQVITAISAQWTALEQLYQKVASQAGDWGIPLNMSADRGRVLGFAQMLASNVYSVATYTGFIGLLVLLGLPEIPRMQAKMRTDLETDTRKEMVSAITSISQQVRVYFGTTLLTSILTGVASAAWALVTGLDLALVWGLLNFLLNFVPVIGNIVGIVPPVLYAFIQFGGWSMPLLVFAGFAVLQIAISNFIAPLLQGRKLSLSPLVIILSMTFWSWVWGIPGALIAVPLTAATVIVCNQFDRSRWVGRLLSTAN